MAIKLSKPVTNARRSYSVAAFKETITHHTPEKSLVTHLKKTGGRNNQGKITTRHIGGGHKKAYRVIDFKRTQNDIVGIVKTIEYDPNRSSYIALVHYLNGVKAYILAAKDLKIGQKIISSEKTEIAIGNHLCLKNIPEGMLVHNVELVPNQGGKLARSAGNFAQVLGFTPETGHVIIRLKSGETRKVLENCRATIGEVGNSEHNLISYGKAGRNRWRGIRPTVRGSVMNPNDHPHGGGEGRSPIGKDAPRTPWGKKALGVLTRNVKKPSQKLLIRRAKNKVVR